MLAEAAPANWIKALFAGTLSVVPKALFASVLVPSFVPAAMIAGLMDRAPAPAPSRSRPQGR
jgi:hypothetical protein